MVSFIYFWLIPFILVLAIGRIINYTIEEDYRKINLREAIVLGSFGIVGLVIMLILVIFEYQYTNNKINRILTYISNKYKE